MKSRRFALRCLAGALFLGVNVLSAYAETVEFVTYYPAPGGAVKDLHVDTLTVGDAYGGVIPNNGVALISTGLWLGAGFDVGNPPPPSQTLYVTGNVGIGMLNPPSLLGLGVGTGAAGTRQAITIGNAGRAAPTAEGTTSNGDKLVMWNDAATNYKASIGLNAANELWLQSSGNNANNKITFYTSNATTVPSERMRIDAAGNVGIGTNAPAGRLHVQGVDDAASNVTFMLGNDNAGVPGVPSIRVGIGIAAPTFPLAIGGGPQPAWTSGFWKGRLELTNGSAIGWPVNAAGQAFGIGHTDGGFHVFRTTSALGTTGSAANYDLFIGDTGKVGIGTTAPGNTLDVIGGAAFQGNHLYIKNPLSPTGTKTWGFVVNSSDGSFVIGLTADTIPTGGTIPQPHIVMHPATHTTDIYGEVNISDARLKTDIMPLAGALGKVSSLQGVRFHWKDRPGDERYHMGLLAQDVEKIFPDLVYTGSDGMKSVASVEMISVLTEAVKELKAENETLKRRLDQLEKR